MSRSDKNSLSSIESRGLTGRPYYRSLLKGTLGVATIGIVGVFGVGEARASGHHIGQPNSIIDVPEHITNLALSAELSAGLMWLGLFVNSDEAESAPSRRRVAITATTVGLAVSFANVVAEVNPLASTLMPNTTADPNDLIYGIVGAAAGAAALSVMALRRLPHGGAAPHSLSATDIPYWLESDPTATQPLSQITNNDQRNTIS